MKNILTTLAVFVMALLVTQNALAFSTPKGASGISIIQYDGEDGTSRTAPVDKNGNAKFDKVTPGQHTFYLLVPAVQKVREAAAGTQADKPKEKWIEIESWSLGASNPTSVSGGGGAGKVSVHDISITKASAGASASRSKTMTGTPKRLPLTNIVKHNGEDYYKVELENVLISSYQSATDPSSGGDRPMESLSLNFTKISFDIKESK